MITMAAPSGIKRKAERIVNIKTIVATPNQKKTSEIISATITLFLNLLGDLV